MLAGSLIAPPTNAAGTDAAQSGTRSDPGTAPADANRHVPTAATTMFIASAAGRMAAGATPKSPIAARYADAPACPTEE